LTIVFKNIDLQLLVGGNVQKLGFAVLFGIFVVMLFSFGCSSRPTATQYVCSDGTVASSPSDCSTQPTSSAGTGSQPAQQSPEQEVPAPSQEPACTPNWDCTDWSVCSSFGTQTRSCTDANYCGVTTGKPAESQTCTPIIVEPDSITISGTGQEATQEFRLEEGLSIFRMEYPGDRNFIIWLMDDQGNREELLVNNIGDFSGSKAVGIDNAGAYILDVNADDEWTVTIEQPRSPTAFPVPKVITGVGQKATEFVYLEEGLTRFEMRHNGDSNFIIWLMDKDGNLVDSLVNEIGDFEGSKAVRIDEAGPYLLGVTADGNWEISIE
jgi:hypothetical protein